MAPSLQTSPRRQVLLLLSFLHVSSAVLRGGTTQSATAAPSIPSASQTVAIVSSSAVVFPQNAAFRPVQIDSSLSAVKPSISATQSAIATTSISAPIEKPSTPQSKSLTGTYSVAQSSQSKPSASQRPQLTPTAAAAATKSQSISLSASQSNVSSKSGTSTPVSSSSSVPVTRSPPLAASSSKSPVPSVTVMPSLNSAAIRSPTSSRPPTPVKSLSQPPLPSRYRRPTPSKQFTSLEQANALRNQQKNDNSWSKSNVFALVGAGVITTVLVAVVSMVVISRRFPALARRLRLRQAAEQLLPMHANAIAFLSGPHAHRDGDTDDEHTDDEEEVTNDLESIERDLEPFTSPAVTTAGAGMRTHRRRSIPTLNFGDAFTGVSNGTTGVAPTGAAKQHRAVESAAYSDITSARSTGIDRSPRLPQQSPRTHLLTRPQ